MPNYQDDPRYQREQPGQGAPQPHNVPGKEQIQRSSGPGSRPQQPYSPQQPSPMPPLPQAADNQSRQEPLIPKPAQGQLMNVPQRQVAPEYDTYPAATARRTSEPLGIVDYIMIGAIIFLVGALIAVGSYLLARFSIHVNFGNFPNPIILLLIYAACVGAGYLWGRYQSQTAAMKENVALKDESTLLRREIDRLKRENVALQNQPRTTSPVSPGAPVPAVVSQPRPIEQVSPPPSIYDNPREPDDPGDLGDHPHEKIFPGEGNALRHGWLVIGASRRGYGHAYEGKYREDDFAVKMVSAGRGRSGQADLALIAIADGVSSKKLSRRGARAAVLGATSMPEQRLRGIASLAAHRSQYNRCSEEAYSLLMEALLAAHDNVDACAQHYLVSVEELQSTLLVFLAVPADDHHMFVASTQVGDGALFAFQPHKGHAPRDTWKWLQQPQIQEAGNEVQPFMRTGIDDWGAAFRVEVLENAACIMGMTDGIADDIEPPRPTPDNRNPDPFLNVDDFYQRIITPSFHNARPGEALIQSIGYRKKQSHDDRTVVCLYHR